MSRNCTRSLPPLFKIRLYQFVHLTFHFLSTTFFRFVLNNCEECCESIIFEPNRQPINPFYEIENYSILVYVGVPVHHWIRAVLYPNLR